MLSFDSNHSFIHGNLNKKKGKKTLKNIVIGSLIISNIFTFSGCSKDIGCGIDNPHAHFYTNEEDIGRYIVSEKENIANLKRQENYVSVSKEDAELLNFLNEFDLYKIDDNLNAINSITTNFKDHKEYQYEHLYLKPVIRDEIDGKPIIRYETKIGYSWTSYPTRGNLTGEERMCHFVYYGYKVSKNANGEYVLTKSSPVDNLSDLPEGYDYINGDFYNVVNLYNKDEVFTYETIKSDQDPQLVQDESTIHHKVFR